MLPVAARLRVVRAVRERRSVWEDIVEVGVGWNHGGVVDWFEKDMSYVDALIS